MTALSVVLFTGGRGSEALVRALVQSPELELTLAVNGYDDGKSTGEVRRFLKDSLGPSDFRKNASTLARALNSCAPALVDLLDLRFPETVANERALAALKLLESPENHAEPGWEKTLASLASRLDPALRDPLAQALARFESELEHSRSSFSFSDCSLGNLVFAGEFLAHGRQFNETIADYLALLSIPRGAIENVTDGTNLYLVAIDRSSRLLASEADIVDAHRKNYIDEIYLIDDPPPSTGNPGWPDHEWREWLEARAVRPRPNLRLLERISRADLILYAPGTQHSSLLPSYMTESLGAQIAANLRALKVLVTNLQKDADIPDVSAIEIIAKALYYLREKGQERLSAPRLITHYLLNDPAQVEPDTPYIPLGRLQSLEDPRLVRLANYEEGATGRHNAEKVLTPFIAARSQREHICSVAILLLDTDSLDKIAQTILETLRADLDNIRPVVTFFYCSARDLEASFVDQLPFRTENVAREGIPETNSLLRAAQNGSFDYVLLFESSGMYRGEDIVNLLSLLGVGNLDAVWGSRRLSARDIRESYRLRYRRSPLLGAVSRIGSHLLSLTFLMLYGRYISDTLSGARVVRSRFLGGATIALGDKALNQHLLTRLLGERGEIFETPVRFFPLSPERANRTTFVDGLRALGVILCGRLRRGGGAR